MLMTQSAQLNDIHIDRVHAGAIRREIGERLCMALDAERAPLPARLRSLMQRLAAEDRNQDRGDLHQGDLHQGDLHQGDLH
jgi:hypothetical protein